MLKTPSLCVRRLIGVGGKMVAKIGTILWIICIIHFAWCFFSTDSTDKGFKKSGLGLYVDNATGCHYIKAGAFGATTPRLDWNGRHICGGWEYEKELKGGK